MPDMSKEIKYKIKNLAENWKENSNWFCFMYFKFNY